MKYNFFIAFLSLLFVSCNSQTKTPKELLESIKKDNLTSFSSSLKQESINDWIKDESNDLSYTLLGYACKYKKNSFVDVLLKKGSDINLAKTDDIYEYDALYVAIESQNIEAVNILLKEGAKVNKMYDEMGFTPLALSCKTGNTNITKALLEKKANVNGANAAEGLVYVPLIIATENKNKELIKTLLAFGANPSVKNNKNETAIDVAQKTNDTELLQLLSTPSQAKTKEIHTKIKKVTYNSTDNSLHVTTDKKTISFDNIEFLGYKCTSVSVNNDIITVSYSNSSGSLLSYKSTLDATREKLIMNQVENTNVDKNDYDGKSNKCTLSGLSLNIDDIDSETLFNDLQKQKNCTSEYRDISSIDLIASRITKELKNDKNFLKSYGKDILRYKAYLAKYPLTEKNVQHYNDVAFYLEQSTLYDESIVILKEITTTYPDRVVSWLNLGDAQFGKKDISNAKQSYKKYIDLMKKQNKDLNKIPKRVYDRIK